MPLTVRGLNEDEFARWDAFVERCPEATFFHLAGWSQVLKRLGHRVHYLYAERNGDIVGVLPLGQIRSLLFGHSLISTPFCVYGGVACEDEEARGVLLEQAQESAVRLGVDYLEIRGLEAQTEDWPTKELYVTFRRPIHEDPDANLKDIPRKQRAMVRKGAKAGLTSSVDDGLDTFFEIYSTSVRNLGTPVFSRKYFETLREVFSNRSDILTISRDGRAVSSVLSFYFRDTALPYYGGGLPEARQVKAYDFMYWELMVRAAENGYRVFDFGRSKVGTGSYSFKKNWGFVPEPLHYQYHLVKATEIPNVTPVNPKYRLFVEAWKRLPLPVANVVGPVLSRNLG